MRQPVTEEVFVEGDKQIDTRKRKKVTQLNIKYNHCSEELS